MSDSSPAAPRVLYLHGFASSPQSRKACRFAEEFETLGWDLVVPDLNPPDFRELTVGGMLEVGERVIESAERVPVAIIGSSLGGYLATCLLARRVRVCAAVLMAPAFDLRARWSARLGPDALRAWERLGTISIYHHGLDRECPLGYRFFDESRGYPAYPDPGDVPVLAFHGREDDVVPLDCVEEFGRRFSSAEIRVFEDDHSLLESTDRIIAESIDFLGPRFRQASENARPRCSDA